MIIGSAAATLNYQTNLVSTRDDGPRWLIQLHPLELDRGPIEINQQTTKIGRSKECDIQIDDDSVSRLHIEIRKTSDGFLVVDCESTNGVLVNDQRVNSLLLRSGDRLQLGTRIFRFLANSDFESQYHETVYNMMTRDGLTGVHNKRYLLECLQREVARCKRFQRPMSVLLMDVDHFKKINDSFGHLVGDEVLKELARRLQCELREDEVLARFGGEEFAVVMVEVDPQQALQIGERCRLAICSTPFPLSSGPLDVSVSVGVSAPAILDLDSVDQLLSEADARLYEAKRNGRNRVVSQ